MKQKVLFVVNHELDKAGVPTVIMNIVRSLKAEFTFDVLMFTKTEGYYDEEFLSYGGKIFRISRKSGLFWDKADYYIRSKRMHKETLKVIKENGPYAAVHCNCHLEAGPCLAAAKKAGVKTRIAHIHVCHKDSHIISRMYDAAYRKMINSSATHRVGCSATACETTFSESADYTVINNPYDSLKFAFSPLTEPLSSPALIQVGSFSDNKNQLFSLEVVAEIKKTYRDVKFNLVGFDLGNIQKEIEQRIKDLGLSNNVRLLPCDADSAALLKTSSGMLFPSKKEGFGLVAVEAQAAGVKCFASDTVPSSTDCGGMEYLPLSAGAKYWADRIIEDFQKNGGKHERFDCSAFSAENVAEQYSKIYSSRDKG